MSEEKERREDSPPRSPGRERVESRRRKKTLIMSLFPSLILLLCVEDKKREKEKSISTKKSMRKKLCVWHLHSTLAQGFFFQFSHSCSSRRRTKSENLYQCNVWTSVPACEHRNSKNRETFLLPSRIPHTLVCCRDIS